MRKTWGSIRIRISIGFKNGKSDPDLEEQFKSGRFRLPVLFNPWILQSKYLYIPPSRFCAVQSTVQSERCTYLGTVDNADCVQNCECRFASQLIKNFVHCYFLWAFSSDFFVVKHIFCSRNYELCLASQTEIHRHIL
jgi:hypothetical protein